MIGLGRRPSRLAALAPQGDGYRLFLAAVHTIPRGAHARTRRLAARQSCLTIDERVRRGLVQKPGAFSSWSCQSNPISLMMRLLITMIRESFVAKLWWLV